MIEGVEVVRTAQDASIAPHWWPSSWHRRPSAPCCYAVLGSTRESRHLSQRLGFTLQPCMPDRRLYPPLHVRIKLAEAAEHQRDGCVLVRATRRHHPTDRSVTAVPLFVHGLRRGATRLRDVLADERATTEKKMFDGLAMLVHGIMAVGVYGDDLLARTGPDMHETLLTDPASDGST